MPTLQATFSHFQQYVRRPYYTEPLVDQPGNDTSATTRQFLGEYPLIVSLMLIVAGITLLTQYTTGQDMYKSVIQRLVSSTGVSMIALPLAVILEEAVFRAILRLTPNRIRNIAALLLLIPLGYYYHIIKEVANELAVLWLIPGWAFAAYFLGRYLKRPVVFPLIDVFWQANFRWIFYGIALLYTFGKTVNNIDTLVDGHVVLLPVWILALSLNSFYFGYVRMIYGFWYGVAVHVLLLIASLTPEVIRIL